MALHYKIELSWDHPRVCGKNLFQLSLEDTGAGSPPRVREKLALGGLAMRPYGITPACAGKTLPSCLSATLSQDHPRVCGKNCLATRIFYFVPGSPPRVREKRDKHIIRLVKLRITPACAGKTKLRNATNR